MHLASKKRQKVRVAGRVIEFRAGETIHTENSYKYTLDSFGALARGVGMDAGRRCGPTPAQISPSMRWSEDRCVAC